MIEDFDLIDLAKLSRFDYVLNRIFESEILLSLKVDLGRLDHSLLLILHFDCSENQLDLSVSDCNLSLSFLSEEIFGFERSKPQCLEGGSQ